MNTPEASSIATKLAVTGAALLAMNACSNSPDVLANLNESQHNNIKLAAAHHVQDLLKSYDRADISVGPGRIDADESEDGHTTDVKSGKPLDYSKNRSVTIKAGTNADGASITVTRTNVEYCTNPAKKGDNIVDAENCDQDNGELYTDTGYKAVFVNPDIASLNPDAPLTPRAMNAFIASPDTYVSTIGDQYKLHTLFIDKTGHVTKDGYIQETESPAETVRTLADMAIEE